MIKLIGLCIALSTQLVFADTRIQISTNQGDVELKLYDEKTPATVENFLSYIKEDFYAETLFHRVIPGFMVQGGGFEVGMVKKPTKAPVKNEAQSFIPNKRGTIAMARTSAPDSATSQFFINLVNNNFLNKSASQAGYAVFGEVVNGLEVIDAIAETKTGRRGPYGDVPVNDVIIRSIKVLTKPTQ